MAAKVVVVKPVANTTPKVAPVLSAPVVRNPTPAVSAAALAQNPALSQWAIDLGDTGLSVPDLSRPESDPRSQPILAVSSDGAWAAFCLLQGITGFAGSATIRQY